MTYTEADLREAFKAGWKERDRSPGLKRVAKKNMGNALLGAMGGGRFSEVSFVPDHKVYRHSIWLNSAFRKARSTKDNE